MLKNSKKSHLMLILTAAVSALLFCGCRSDRYNQNQAAEAARAFLLENAPELSASQVAYVKYNDPFLMTGEGLEGKSIGLKQICVTWDIPGTEKLYMVFGVSRERMDNWSPNRLIRKNYVKPSPEITAAIESSRKFAVTSFLDTLSKDDLNIIRLSNPEIVITDFALRSTESINNPNDASLNKFDEEKKEKTGYPPQAVQISLIWKISEHHYAVFCGIANNISLAGWNINFAGIMKDYEVNTAIKKFLKKPDSYNTPITESGKLEK